MYVKTIEQLIEEDKQDENLQMCRRLRKEFGSQFKSLDAMFAYLEKMPGKGKKPVPKARSAKAVPIGKTTRHSTSRDPRKAVG